MPDQGCQPRSAEWQGKARRRRPLKAAPQPAAPALRNHGAGSLAGAGGRTRTDNLLPEADFESAASTNSATPACRAAHLTRRLNVARPIWAWEHDFQRVIGSVTSPGRLPGGIRSGVALPSCRPFLQIRQCVDDPPAQLPKWRAVPDHSQLLKRPRRQLQILGRLLVRRERRGAAGRRVQVLCHRDAFSSHRVIAAARPGLDAPSQKIYRSTGTERASPV